MQHLLKLQIIKLYQIIVGSFRYEAIKYRGVMNLCFMILLNYA